MPGIPGGAVSVTSIQSTATTPLPKIAIDIRTVTSVMEVVKLHNKDVPAHKSCRKPTEFFEQGSAKHRVAEEHHKPPLRKGRQASRKPPVWRPEHPLP